MKCRRRKKGMLPVSFFAFQDIITALAGVILILVLLTLYQKSRILPAAADNHNAVPLKQYQSLQQKIAFSKSRLAGTRRQLDEMRKNFQADRQQQENLRRSRELTAALPEMEKLIQKRKKQLATLQKEQAALQQQLSKYSDDDLQKLRERFYCQLNNNLTYQVKSTGGKEVLLLTIARREWQFSAAGGKKISYLPAEAMNLLIEELKKFPSGKVHLLIAVRPSAGAFAESVKNHLQQQFPAMEITAEPLMSEKFGGLTL